MGDALVGLAASLLTRVRDRTPAFPSVLVSYVQLRPAYRLRLRLTAPSRGAYATHQPEEHKVNTPALCPIGGTAVSSVGLRPNAGTRPLPRSVAALVADQHNHSGNPIGKDSRLTSLQHL